MKRLASLSPVLLTILLPIFLIMTAIRILLIPYLYVNFEYNTPNFPSDSYGFTLEDRLQWSKVSFDYLLNSEPLSWLANQKLPDGKPLYVERELSHMLDVKNLIQSMFVAWWILLAGLILAGLAAWRWKTLKSYWRALSNGGWLTLGLIVAILVFVVLSFDWLFTTFHRLFFTGDTWLFLYSDTLIRLFPIPFWQDAFIWMGVFTVILALLFGYFGRQLSKEK
jgi:integral membrane protein (TIGR01906 family)